MDETIETLGTVGDTTTLLEADDEERSSRPDVGTDTYTVSAVVTDASGTQHGGYWNRYEHRFSSHVGTRFGYHDGRSFNLSDRSR